MSRTFALCVAFAALQVVPHQIQADTGKTILNDTQVFFTACTTRIPNVAFHVPMKQRCVATARQLCDLSMDGRGAGRCLSLVSQWLEQDSARIRSALPDAQELVELPGGMAPLPLAAEQVVDCTQINVPNVSSDMICTSQDALSRWMKFRVVELSNQTREELKRM